MSKRKIIHLDMDCFYAAVEEKFHPELKGKPVGIGGPPNTRSVLCTANYEARKYGVKAALPSSQAVRKCPHLILIPPNFPLYISESKKVREILERYTTKIEPLSLDEAYMDVTDCELFQGSATLIAKDIRRAIFEELNLTASAGIAPNKFLAKVASDWKKPNGQFAVPPENVAEFVRTLPVSSIFGVGKVTAEKLKNKGLHTCEDIQKLELFELKKIFGSRAMDFFNLSRGIDDREVIVEGLRKSVSVEETYNQDIDNLDAILAKLPELFEDWNLRMDRKPEYRERLRGLHVKFKYTDFTASTRDFSTTEQPSMAIFEKMIREQWEKRKTPIRLLGIGARLGESEQDSLQLKLLF